MKTGENFFKKLLGIKIFKNKHVKVAIIILLVCIAGLIFVSAVVPLNTDAKTEKQNSTSQFSASSYAKEVQNNLEEVLGNVKGLSNVKVLVVVESSPTIKYLTIDNNGEIQVVYNKQTSTSSSPAIVGEMLPKITGILIVAKGTNDLRLKNNLLNAISATYGVDIAKIDILEGK